MPVEEIKALVETVEGWLAEEEGVLLYHLAQNCSGKGAIVEIGSWKGKSSIWLGRGSQSGKHVNVYAIDPHTGASEHKQLFGDVRTFDEFQANIKMAKVNDVIIPIVKPAAEAAQDFHQPVELIFIDGAHEYEFVKLDFELWYPKVIEGGIMAFHDSTRFEGVSRAVGELVYKSRNFKHVRLVHSTTYAQKVRQNTARDRLRNRYVLFLKRLYELTTKVHLPKQLRSVGKTLFRRIQ